MRYNDEQDLVSALIAFLLKFPLPSPYSDILQEQIAGSFCSVERYLDCIKLFFRPNDDLRPFPLWFPTMPQGCQILKDGGPLSCQLFIEHGYIAQFEVVDMGLNEIDWDLFWAHKAVFDVEYNFDFIKHQLEATKVCIKDLRINSNCIFIELDTDDIHYALHLYGCTIRTIPVAGTVPGNKLQLRLDQLNERRCAVLSETGEIDVICSMICLKDGQCTPK